MKVLALALAAAGLLCLTEARPGLGSDTTKELIRALEMLESMEESKHHPEVAKHPITSKKVDAKQFTIQYVTHPPVLQIRPIHLIYPIEDSVGWFASENFGIGDYLPNLEDTWEFSIPSDKALQLTFNAFNLDNNHDKVTLFDGRDQNARMILDELTGDMSNKVPFMITFFGESMTVVMTTDGSVQRPGFNATYTLVSVDNTIGNAGGNAGGNTGGNDGGNAVSNTVVIEGDFASDCVYAHNNVRSRHGVGGLTWDSDIAAGAQVWAEYLRDNNPAYPHDPDNKLGENIAWRGLPFADSLFECADSVFAWYDEVHDYDYNAPGYGETTGHFTAVVWATTTKVGCGTAVTADNDQWTVCRYDPPGNTNYPQYFVDNVFQLSSGQSYPTSQRDLEQGPCHDKTSTASCNHVVSWGMCDRADKDTDGFRIVCWSACGKC